MSQAPLYGLRKIRSAGNDRWCWAKKILLLFGVVLPIPIPLSAVVKHPALLAAPGGAREPKS
jgi:hypothetical protein